MDIEIERKWLMSTDSAEKIMKDVTSPPIEITQAYFVSTCRVRLSVGVETTAEVTIKLSNSAMSRNEYNYPIPVEDAYEMLERLARIHKHRYDVGNGFTLDQFHGDLTGLYLIEKEYTSEDEAINDEVPEFWEMIDVTGSPVFVNSNLSGKYWDLEDGLVLRAGPTDLGFCGTPFPDNIEYQIITGDEEDVMPPPLVIP